MLEIGKKIKELRLSKKMTQKELAHLLNVTPQAVSKWERNESIPDIQTLVNLGKTFNISVDEILGIKNKSFFDSLFSKLKGSNNMETKNVRTNDQESVGNKKVIIFDATFSFISDSGLLQTQLLSSKLVLRMKALKKSVDIETYSSDRVNQYAKEADIILLTPTFGYAKQEIESNFPGIPVIVIPKREYGLLNIESLCQEIISLLD